MTRNIMRKVAKLQAQAEALYREIREREGRVFQGREVVTMREVIEKLENLVGFIRRDRL